MKFLNRRQFIKTSATGLAGLGLGAYGPARLWANPLASMANPSPDVELRLTAVRTHVSILEGPATTVWAYRGEVLQGPTNSLSQIDDSFLGPTIRVKQGQRVRIHFINRLPEDSIIHWHGLHVPADMDGHPRLAVGPEERYVYDFQVLNRPGTYWYHPHPHGRTGHQVYGGLAGLFIVSDDNPASMGLPPVQQEIALVIQDRTFNAQNRLIYMPNGHMDQMLGSLGDQILVNGRPEKVFKITAGSYRLRILNGSNARLYRLAWDDDAPLSVIGSDGGLLPAPVSKSSVLLAPGERIEVWADFSKQTPGSSRRLIHKPIQGIDFRMGRMGNEVPGLPHGSTFELARFDITAPSLKNIPLPSTFSPIALLPIDQAESVRRFAVAMNHMVGTINGRRFEMTATAPEEEVAAGSLQVWELYNPRLNRGMMSLPMPHPMHIHGVQFQILERQGVRHDGYVDTGWKDTVLLMPGERAQVIMRIGEFEGLFLYHCHNLEHEDGGMMRNYRVTPGNLAVPEPPMRV